MGPIEDILLKFAPTRWSVRILQKILLPGFNGMSFYHLLQTYFNGLIDGAFSARAGA